MEESRPSSGVSGPPSSGVDQLDPGFCKQSYVLCSRGFGSQEACIQCPGWSRKGPRAGQHCFSHGLGSFSQSVTQLNVTEPRAVCVAQHRLQNRLEASVEELLCWWGLGIPQMTPKPGCAPCTSMGHCLYPACVTQAPGPCSTRGATESAQAVQGLLMGSG
jgi:hypothetical protein